MFYYNVREPYKIEFPPYGFMNPMNLVLQNVNSQQQRQLVEAAGGPGSSVSTTYGINSTSVLTKLKYFDSIIPFSWTK